MTAAQLAATPAFLRRIPQLSNSPKFQTLPSITCSASITTHLNSQNDDIGLDFPTKRMFILGMGYVGQFFAQHLKLHGWDVVGTCTSMTKKRILEQKGFDVHVFDAMEPEWKILDDLKCCTHLLVSIPPIDGIGDPLLHHEGFLKDRLVDGNLQWLGYLSTTSVYGDASGAWVDENDSPKPSSNLAKLRLKSEKKWLDLGHDLGLSSYVFRLGGIYGPGRSAIDTILKKEKFSERQIRRATKKFTSRVHVVDICQALKASITMKQQRKVYNIVDDDPASREEVFAFAYQLIEKKWPGLINPTDYSVRIRTVPGAAEKRVSNSSIKNELGLKLVYPSYRSGLQSIINNLQNPVTCNSENN